MNKQVRVGVGFLIFNNEGQFLVQQRQGAMGQELGHRQVVIKNSVKRLNKQLRVKR